MNRHEGKRFGCLYRSRSGIFLGVIKGVANYFDFSVFWARVLTIVAILFFLGFWFPFLYLGAAFLMKPEPVIPLETEDDREFYSSFTSERRLALSRLKRTFESIDRRIRRMETIVTDREYDWDRRLNEDRP